MKYFDLVKKKLELKIKDDLLKAIVFEISRHFDSKFIKEIKTIQIDNNVIIDSSVRKIMRKGFYYGGIYDIDTPYKIKPISYNKEDVEIVFEDFYNRLDKYDYDKIISSIKQRILNLENNLTSDDNMTAWLDYYDSKRNDKQYSFIALKINQEIFENNNYDDNYVFSFINQTYSDLENYRHMAIIFDGELFNEKEECITWKIIYKAGIYAENFIQFQDKFFPFHKEKQIRELTEFLNERNIKDSDLLAEQFYRNISTGYRFEDCYISDNQKTKILIYKKIQLDNSNVPCPSCNTTIQSGNSYPELFLRSWECKNPSCPDRSKSGRGKRFDEYGAYRYFKLVEGNKDNKVDEKTYQNWRRDIFDSDLDYIEFLIKEYTFAKEKICIVNDSITKMYKRKKVDLDFLKLSKSSNSIDTYEDLPIVKLFRDITKELNIKKGNIELTEDLEIINANSADYLQKLKPGQIGCAITSPPYYNAREYSQWQTLIMYFVDMIINCKAVYSALAQNSYYLYNIGDIVSEDNVYVVSNMSKHRVQLGFLSCMIFELAGYNLTGNIIWDKGEVQSKRSSTVNLVSGYVKCVNCYEHVLVFRKGEFEKVTNSVKRITPVIKINSKGENIYKHTAPYPIEIVDLIKDFVKKDLYVLDPYLGSGTTLKWCKLNDYKGIGFELNEAYYDLCLKNIDTLKSHGVGDRL